MGTINELSSFLHALSSLINALSSFVAICNNLQGPRPAYSPHSLWKTFLGLILRLIVVLSASLPSSSPPFPTVLFGAAKLVSVVGSFAGLRLQNLHPRFANLLKRIGSLLAAIGAVGVCIILSRLVHPNLAWICWLAGASIVLAFIISFK